MPRGVVYHRGQWMDRERLQLWKLGVVTMCLAFVAMLIQVASTPSTTPFYVSGVILVMVTSLAAYVTLRWLAIDAMIGVCGVAWTIVAVVLTGATFIAS